MALNDEQQGLSTLGQPLVTPLAPAATPSAVEQLIDAYHKGFITSNDILAHSGALAAAQGKNALDVLNIQPDIIEAQKAQANLSAVQAKAQIGQVPASAALTAAQTQAQLGMVQPTAALAAAQTAKQTAETNYKPALDAYAQYGNLPIWTEDENGNAVRDFESEAQIGRKYLQYQNLAQWASQGLAGKETIMPDPTTGQPRRLWINSFGENVTPSTPDNPNPVYDEYQDHRREALRFLFQNTENPKHPAGVTPDKGAADFVQPAAAPEPPAFSPVTEADVTRATAPVTPLVPIAQPIPGLDLSQFIQPAAPPAAGPTVTVTPTATTIQHPPPAPAVVGPKPMGWPAGPVPGSFTEPQEVVKNLRADPAYQAWRSAAGEISEIKSLASDPKFAGKTPSQQNSENMNDFDFRLGMAVANLTNPKTVEGKSSFKVEELDLKQPYLNKYLQNVKEVLLGRGKFSPQVRKDLLETANQLAAAKENTARDPLKSAVSLFQRSGQDPKAFLTPDEQALATGAPAAGAAPRGQPVTLKSGKTVVLW